MLKPKRKARTQTDFFSRIRKNPYLSRKILRRLVLLLILVSFFYLYFSGDYGFIRLLSLVKEREAIILETKKLQARNMELETEKEKLKKDLFYIEKIAREKHGMAKKDELIYKFVQPEKNPSTPPPEKNK